MTGRLHQVFYYLFIISVFFVLFFFIAINCKCTFANTYLQSLDIHKNE